MEDEVSLYLECFAIAFRNGWFEIKVHGSVRAITAATNCAGAFPVLVRVAASLN